MLKRMATQMVCRNSSVIAARRAMSSLRPSFAITAEQKELQEAARAFATTELPDLAVELERDNKPVPDEWRKRYAEMGFLGINTPEEYGGLGLGHLEALLVLEEFGKVSSAVAFPIFECLVGPIKAVQRFGSDEMKRRLLPDITAGEFVVAVAMSEPDAGSAATDMTTAAEPDPSVDGGMILTGQKRWCSGAGHSDMIVFCKMDPEAKGARGLGAVYVQKDASGVTFGPAETLMGFRGVPSADIYFDHVKIAPQDVLLPAGNFNKMMQAFCLERLGNATLALANAQAARDEVLAYTQERKQFGKPLVDFQAVQLRLAEMEMKTTAARLLIHAAAARADNDAAVAADGVTVFPTVSESSLAKCFSNSMAVEVVESAMICMGGYGYSTAFNMERRMRDVLGWRVAGGSVDIQKVNITAGMVGRRFDQRR